jgi:hypothetical protein
MRHIKKQAKSRWHNYKDANDVLLTRAFFGDVAEQVLQERAPHLA